MSIPKTHKKAAPEGWLNHYEISQWTGNSIHNTISLLSNKGQRTGPYYQGYYDEAHKWIETEHWDNHFEWEYESYEVEDPDFVREGGVHRFCLPEDPALDVIRIIRKYRIAKEKFVPTLPDGFLEDDGEPTPPPREPERQVYDVRATFQRGYRSGWAFFYQENSNRRYPFLKRRNGRVLVLTPQNYLRAWGDGNSDGEPTRGDTWDIIVNGEQATLAWIGSRWQTAAPLDVDVRDKLEGK